MPNTVVFYSFCVCVCFCFVLFRHNENSSLFYRKKASLCNDKVEFRVSVPLYNLMRGNQVVRTSPLCLGVENDDIVSLSSGLRQRGFRHPILVFISPNLPV